MANDLHELRLGKTGGNSQGDKGVPAVICSHALHAYLSHQIFEVSFGVIGNGVVSVIGVNEPVVALRPCFEQQGPVCLQTDGANRDHAIFTRFGLGSTNEIIVVAVCKRDVEQLVRSCSRGNQDQRDGGAGKARFLDGFNLITGKGLPRRLVLCCCGDVLRVVLIYDAFIHSPFGKLAKELQDLLTGRLGFACFFHLENYSLEV